MGKRSDINLAMVLAATLATAVYSGVHSVGPGANLHTLTAFAAGEPGDPKMPARAVEITMREGDGEMTFAPAEIEVRKGEQIRFVLKNQGERDHDFILDSFEGNAKHKIAMEKDPEMEHGAPNVTRTTTKNSSELLWRFTTAGAFEFACLHPGHYDAGMKGVVLVSDGASRGERYLSLSESN
jgi:uncharacterized cupredoxin-like copper-binding protein